MSRNTLCICALVSAVLLTAGLPVDGYAGTSHGKLKSMSDSKATPFVGKNTIVVSGVVSGSLQGRIRPTRGREVVITEQTRIYKTGKGPISRGTYLANSPVYIVGVVKRGVVYADMIIVSDPKKDERGGKVRKLGAKEPL
jgi:hypothetical protein